MRPKQKPNPFSIAGQQILKLMAPNNIYYHDVYGFGNIGLDGESDKEIYIMKKMVTRSKILQLQILWAKNYRTFQNLSQEFWGDFTKIK